VAQAKAAKMTVYRSRVNSNFGYGHAVITGTVASDVAHFLVGVEPGRKFQLMRLFGYQTGSATDTNLTFVGPYETYDDLWTFISTGNRIESVDREDLFKTYGIELVDLLSLAPTIDGMADLTPLNLRYEDAYILCCGVIFVTPGQKMNLEVLLRYLDDDEPLN
jgi:hypothetical protein